MSKTMPVGSKRGCGRYKTKLRRRQRRILARQGRISLLETGGVHQVPPSLWAVTTQETPIPNGISHAAWFARRRTQREVHPMYMNETIASLPQHISFDRNDLPSSTQGQQTTPATIPIYYHRRLDGRFNLLSTSDSNLWCVLKQNFHCLLT